MFPLASTTFPGAAHVRPARARDSGAFEAVPLLPASAERLLASLLKAIGTMAGATTTVEGALVGYRRMALRDHLASQQPGAVAGVLECVGVECTILATLDPTLVYAIVELLCGGNGSDCQPDDMRPATAIDAQYAHTIVSLSAGAVMAEWRDRGFESVKPVRIAGVPAADVCGAQTREVGVVTLALAIFGLRGLLTLALPAAALAAFGDEDSIGAGSAETDSIWRAQLRQEVGRTAIRVDVLLDASPLSLRQLSELKPGQVVALAPDARMRAALVCDGRLLHRGELGQDDNRYSIRIDEIAPAITPATFARNPLDPSIKD